MSKNLLGSSFRWNPGVSVTQQRLSFEGNGPRIRVSRIDLPLTASTHLIIRIVAGNVLLTRWQTNKQTNLFNFVRPSFQSRERCVERRMNWTSAWIFLAKRWRGSISSVVHASVGFQWLPSIIRVGRMHHSSSSVGLISIAEHTQSILSSHDAFDS